MQAFGSFLLFSPGKARHDDHTLAIYEAAGFSSAQADQAAAAVFTFVLGNALGTAADYGAAPGGSFEFGLRAILDGLEGRLAASRAPAGQNRSRATPP